MSEQSNQGEFEWRIYHNPRCTKSRRALELLDDRDIAPEIVLYLNDPPSARELAALCEKLDVPPTDLLRTHEPLCAELGAQRQAGEELLATIAAHPILLKRPIVVRGNRAVLGIPPENVLTLLDGSEGE